MLDELTEPTAPAPTSTLRGSRPTGVRAWFAGYSDADEVLSCVLCGWCAPVSDDPGDRRPAPEHVCRTAPDVSIVVVPDAVRSTLRWVAGAVLVLALVAAGALALRHDAAPARATTAPPASTTALLVSGSSLSYADARETADALGWQTRIYSLPGAGLSRSTLDPSGSITSTARRLLPSPDLAHDVVVVQGGEADHASSPDVVEVATEHLLDYVRAHAGPQAQVILVGPIPGETVPASMTRVNEVLQQVAAQRGVPFVDALAHGWRVGDPALRRELAAELRAAADR